jgi:AmmeMemoRadiSam system protein B/AmmeMemoRadiSam system protein A
MQSSARNARPPAVAGAFYPAAADQLSGEVRGLLAAACRGPVSPSTDLKALIVPHAGYVYSGPVAASAYAALRGSEARIERVVLFGPAHRVPVRGLAAPATGAFETPLGEVPIDRASVQRAGALPQVSVDDRPHAPEHSLEVQLPFLQHVLGRFQLVPFVVGDASADEVAEVMELLWGGPETLIVVSSDLSHYYDHATARRLDAATSRAIESLDPGGLDPESACGRVPIGGLLVAARRHGLFVDALDVRNSGDTAGPRDQVVGYGSYALRERSDSQKRSADDVALELARSSTEHAVETGRTLPVDHALLPARLLDAGACFVTLERQGRLRGCVGEIEGVRPLATSIVENARNAALCDARFPPVGFEELSDIRVKLSLLEAPEALEVSSRAELVAALRPGVDGVVVTERGRRATFLPAVWEKLPTPESLVTALEQKAGLTSDWSSERRAWTYRVRELG